jgi:bis(5'-nucleosidyl)-tetraphosphatase
MSIKMKKKITGSGIVAVLDNTKERYSSLNKDILYLVLIDKKNKYDFPKGGIDYGESVFDCALRETKEECNLTKEDFFDFYSENPSDSFICGDGLLMFLGFVNNANNVRVVENPKTLQKEHIKFLWLTFEEIISSNKLYSYLVPALVKSHKIVKQM